MPLVAKYTKTNLRTVQIHHLRTSNLRDRTNTGQNKAHWLSEGVYKRSYECVILFLHYAAPDLVPVVQRPGSAKPDFSSQRDPLRPTGDLF
jgi:hypothetical protein